MGLPVFGENTWRWLYLSGLSEVLFRLYHMTLSQHLFSSFFSLSALKTKTSTQRASARPVSRAAPGLSRARGSHAAPALAGRAVDGPRSPRGRESRCRTPAPPRGGSQRQRAADPRGRPQNRRRGSRAWKWGPETPAPAHHPTLRRLSWLEVAAKARPPESTGRCHRTLP